MKNFFFLLFLSFIIVPAAEADSLRIGCLKLKMICNSGKGCVWWGEPGQAFNIEMFKKLEKSDYDLYEGKLDASIEDQKFSLKVLQKRVSGKSPVHYIHLELPISQEIVISSEGLAYSHAKYVNKAKNEGLTIRCSTGI